MSYFLSDPFAEYGTLDMEVEPEELIRHKDGLDTSMQVWQTSAEDSFPPGSAPPLRPLMRIKEVFSKRDGPRWVHRLMSEGFVNSADKIESNRIRRPEEGFDEGPLTVLTLRPQNYLQGMSHPLYPSLVITDLEAEDINAHGHIWRMQCACRGIYLPKAVKRRYSTNGKEITSTTAFAIAGFGGGAPQNWTTPLQRVQMTERFLMNGMPPTHLIGQQLIGAEIPTDTPTINSSAVDTLSTTGRRWNFPNAWTVINVTAERLMAGRLEHDVTVQYAYLPVSEPGGQQA